MRHSFLALLLLLVIMPSCHHGRRIARNRSERTTTKTVTRSSTKTKTVTTAEQKKYTPESYIAAWKDVAIKQMRKNGIPASITLAQALLESANGNSTLAREANNHFGIKCTKDWTGKTYYRGEGDNRECYRKYNNASESFADHTEFLRAKRYAALFKLGSRDYRGWAQGLKNAGYATNPKYPQLLINMIEKYDLSQYDR